VGRVLRRPVPVGRRRSRSGDHLPTGTGRPRVHDRSRVRRR
jgi:hypothetical protein